MITMGMLLVLIGSVREGEGLTHSYPAGGLRGFWEYTAISAGAADTPLNVKSLFAGSTGAFDGSRISNSTDYASNVDDSKTIITGGNIFDSLSFRFVKFPMPLVPGGLPYVVPLSAAESRAAAPRQF